jgi:hypothetical protein
VAARSARIVFWKKSGADKIGNNLEIHSLASEHVAAPSHIRRDTQRLFLRRHSWKSISEGFALKDELVVKGGNT